MKPRRMVARAALRWLLMGAIGSAGLAAAGSRWPGTVEAQFRGCDDAGTCRFWIDARDAEREGIYRVRPDGVSWIVDGEQNARAVRDRLNALLSNMIHQHKRVELHGMRAVGEKTYAARVTVNGDDLANDPVLAQLAHPASQEPH